MKRILVIDDDVPTRVSLQARLEKEDYEVLTAEDGSTGLSIAERESPSLIVLNLAMPDIDGVDVLDRLRQSAVTWDVPVVVLTGGPSENRRKNLSALGISGLLTKPLSPRTLVVEIKRVLGLVEPPGQPIC